MEFSKTLKCYRKSEKLKKIYFYKLYNFPVNYKKSQSLALIKWEIVILNFDLSALFYFIKVDD